MECVCPYESCKKILANKETLKNHIKTHTGEKPYKCRYDGCSYSCIQKGNLDVHERIHSGEKPYKCNSCEKCFSQKPSLDKHIRTHTGEKPYKCDECNKCFSQKSGYDLHVKIHSGEKPYKCDYDGCNYACVQKQVLESHKLIHTGERPFKCQICDKAFRDSKGLSRHKVTHADERPYKCNTCNKSFTTSTSLKEHTLIHQNLKPYLCEFENCKYCARTPSQLKSHIRQNHTGEKPYKCSYENCTDTFVSRSMMIYHLHKVHTNERPFKCSYEGCGIGFITKGQLEIHIRTHTGERPYVCDACGSSYISHGGLIAHNKSFHTKEGQLEKKKEEARIAKLLDLHKIDYKREHQISFDCSGNTFCRIDFVIISNGNVIFLEIDEHQHSGYDPSCEVKRMAMVQEHCFMEGNTLPIIFIRYNPNDFSINGSAKKVTRKHREINLMKLLSTLMSNKTTQPLSIVYMYYDIDDANKPIILTDDSYPDVMKSLVINVINQ